ncbi:MAG: hypothetical protein H8D45_20175 [Bacteroidetes bacterium]|nr:hypothetical protein [Bacteroidota bacterium]MBL7104300.1 hypothetical protein [Bacteroidales bacterium]
MNLSILIGIIGIIASVGVGLGTFFIADKRARRNRYLTMKNLIIQALSKSLSENNIPNKRIIKSTINSLVRENGVSNLRIITVEEIIDDLVYQITSDPFLDAERRETLQNNLLEILEPKKVKIDEIAEETISDIKQLEIHEDYKQANFSRYSSILSILSGVITTIVAGIIISQINTDVILNFIKSSANYVWLLSGLITGIIAVIIKFIFSKNK